MVVASDSIQTYQVAVVGYLAAGMVLTSASVNSLVFSNNGAREAAAAGFILISMVTVSPGILFKGSGRDTDGYSCHRSCGSSTLAQLPMLFHAPTSTRSLSAKKVLLAVTR